MRIYIALSTIVTTLCYMDRGDDMPETLRTPETPRPEWQEWVRGTIITGGIIFSLAFLMAWLGPTP